MFDDAGVLAQHVHVCSVGMHPSPALSAAAVPGLVDSAPHIAAAWHELLKLGMQQSHIVGMHAVSALSLVHQMNASSSGGGAAQPTVPVPQRYTLGLEP